MKKLILMLVVIFIHNILKAQDYYVSFSGSGESANVSSIKVENLTSGSTLILNGTDILRLMVSIPTGIIETSDIHSPGIKIYPNPMKDRSMIVFDPPTSEYATISIYEMTGILVFQSGCYLENHRQEFSVTGLIKGLYLISVKSNSYQFSGKLLSIGESQGIIKIVKNSNIAETVEVIKYDPEAKGQQSVIDMVYPEGSRLKFTGFSGVYSSVITDIPTSDKTLTFNFIACTDGDNNNYPVLTINNQIWMAENLKTTKYMNGVSIGTTIPFDKDISGENEPTYQWAYVGNESNVNTYGRLYTWYTAMDSRSICPTGWHIPTEVEWTTLEQFLIANGYNYDGSTSVSKIAKALAATVLWRSNTITGTPGNKDYPAKRNSTGFTALPGGYRFETGLFGGIEEYAYWLTPKSNSLNTWSRSIYFDSIVLFTPNSDKKTAHSVRCLKD